MLIWSLALAVLHPVPMEPPTVSLGPFVGHVTSESVSIWARGSAEGEFELHVVPLGAPETSDGENWQRVSVDAYVDRDLCMVFHMDGLAPATTYRYFVAPPGEPGDICSFNTAPTTAAPAQVSLAFGACANASGGAQAVWDRIDEVGTDVVVLLGDTPYIDTTDLAIQQQRYADFASIDALHDVLSHTPWYATWDDHDFGLNDTDGNLPGKEFSRRAFEQYHANPSYGDGEVGVYTRFRYGPVEVFLLDTRSFAATTPSPVNAGAPTLLGAQQWSWLLQNLQQSDATFKVLASGMIWNRAVRPNKTDHWATYAHERDALFEFIGKSDIDGVVLVGGDVHRSRVIRHATGPRAGYDLTELITSPMHGGVIEAANAPHPGLIWDAGVPNVFMLMTADTTVSPATLTAQFINKHGTVLHTETLTTTRLRSAVER